MIQKSFCLLPDSEFHYDVKKIHVHRWPKDSPPWDDSVQRELDDSVNKNPESKKVTIKEKTILIGNIEFYSLKKIGISVPFFKKECAMIFEAQFGKRSDKLLPIFFANADSGLL